MGDLTGRKALVTGAGIGILPAFSADIDERLEVVLPDQIRFIRTFWMLMPEELRHIARMRVTWDFLRERAEENRGRLMATAPTDELSYRPTSE